MKPNAAEAWRVIAQVVEALTDPAVIVDRNAAIVLANTAARAAWPALTPGQPLAFTLRSPDLVEAVAEGLAGRGPTSGMSDERVPVERTFSFRASGLDVAGQHAVLVVFRDLTAFRRLESMRVDFIANASHELRTPLASLLGFIETLQGPARGDEAARDRFLAIMREQARRMARLVDDLLSLSRIEMVEHRQPDLNVDLDGVAAQVVDMLRPLAKERGVAVQLVAPSRVTVRGDRDELLRVAENLVENAIRYGEDGKRVEISVSEIVTDAASAACLAVRDWGPGIPAQHLPRLTERFYRVDDAASRNKGGTGLGLAIVKHIVNRHRGRLEVNSRPGEGALFRVVLPAAHNAAQDERQS